VNKEKLPLLQTLLICFFFQIICQNFDQPHKIITSLLYCNLLDSWPKTWDVKAKAY
jgi:hypothetical protein